jgi:hypothetical protein
VDTPNASFIVNENVKNGDISSAIESMRIKTFEEDEAPSSLA